MTSVITLSSIILAAIEAGTILKLSIYPSVSTEYAASIVGYNSIATVTLVSAITSLFNVWTTPIAFGVAILCVLGVSAIAVDGLMPPTGNRYVEKGIDLMVNTGIFLAIYSVPLLAFPTRVSPFLQL